jgi:hypothetical protein
MAKPERIVTPLRDKGEVSRRIRSTAAPKSLLEGAGRREFKVGPSLFIVAR